MTLLKSNQLAISLVKKSAINFNLSVYFLKTGLIISILTNINKELNMITFDELLEAAGAIKLTQFGMEQCRHYADATNASYVVSCLRTLEHCHQKAVFIYEHGTVQPIEGVN